MKGYILVIDDEQRHRKLYAGTLKRANVDVRTADSAETAQAVMQEAMPAMVVSDVRMPGMDGISFLRQVRQNHPDLPFLLITAFADIRDAVKALKLGAVDYLEKPIDLDELVAAVTDALGLRPVEQDGEIPPAALEGLIAESPAMRAIFRDAYRVAQSDAGVLITGESGSGKEVVARFVHRCSERSAACFVAVNCAAVPPNLLSSQLFGHERGAFTGAVGPRKGVFRESHGGTLFLDEIGDMTPELQAALLRAIETGTISPVGSDDQVAVDFRLITATNKDLTAEVEKGTFREDLYYRLNVIAFHVPPLRERPEDILPLARHFLAAREGKEKRLSPSTARVIQQYSWPGNVRELANAMQRAVILATTEVILPEHLPPTVTKPPEGATPGTPSSEVKTIHEAEQEAIRSALKRTDGNRTKAAELLGISRRALIYKLKRLTLP